MAFSREERIAQIENQKIELEILWKNGITGLELNSDEIKIIKNIFENWAIHFQFILLKNGIEPIITNYENLINSIETATCIHENIVNSGEDYHNCCGVYYEYLNDISCRTAIEILLNTIPYKIPIDTKKQIELLDKRFKDVPKNTKWIVNSDTIDKYKELNYWWYFGLPLTVKE